MKIPESEFDIDHTAITLHKRFSYLIELFNYSNSYSYIYSSLSFHISNSFCTFLLFVSMIFLDFSDAKGS